jgi:hypothetical protein
MQRLEVSSAVRHIYIYIYIYMSLGIKGLMHQYVLNSEFPQQPSESLSVQNLDKLV